MRGGGDGHGSVRNSRGPGAPTTPPGEHGVHKEDGMPIQTRVSEQPQRGQCTTEQGTGGAQRKWDEGGQGSCQAGFIGAAEVRREGGWLPEQGGSTEGPVWEQCMRTREAKAGDMRGPGCRGLHWDPDCCGREWGDVPPGGARGMRCNGTSICVCVCLHVCTHTWTSCACLCMCESAHPQVRVFVCVCVRVA